MEAIHYPYKTKDFNGMPYRRLGDCGLSVSNVGLGTWKFGFPDTGDGSRVDAVTGYSILNRALELGVTFWDTANAYNAGTGQSEQVIGKWFQANKSARRNIVLASKVEVGLEGFTPNHSGLSRENILDGVDGCLRRLGVDYIDLLYFHHKDPDVPVQESLEAVEDLVRAGKVRYFAVSNFQVPDLKEYAIVNEGMTRRTRVSAVQNEYNILLGETMPNVLDYCSQNGIAFIAYSPLGRGLLSGKYRKVEDMGDNTRMVQDKLLSRYSQDVMEKLNKLIDLSKEVDIPLPMLTLAYMLTLQGMGPVIPACSSIEQLEQNAKAGTVKLDDCVISKIKEIVG